MFRFAVLTVSDTCSREPDKDRSGRLIADLVKSAEGEMVKYDIVPDEVDRIGEKLIDYCDNLKADVVFTTGGTGLGPRDVTPEATQDVAERLVPGMSELIRLEGLKKTKRAALSRGITAIRGGTVIINLPGSPKAVEESLQAILDLIPHALDMLHGQGHGSGPESYGPVQH